MALIPCCECKRKVSEKASTCPKCGAPVGPSVEAFEKKKKGDRNGCIGCLGVVGVVILLAIFNSRSNDGRVPFGDRHNSSSTPQAQPSPQTQPSLNDFDYKVRQVGNSMVYENLSGKDLTGVKFYADGKPVTRSRFPAGSTETIALETFGLRPGVEVQTTMISCDQGHAVRNQ
jgi:hypothetical protein